MLKKKSRLKSKRALLARGARLRKIRKLRALKSKRVVHKRTGKGRSAWLKKETYGAEVPEQKTCSTCRPGYPYRSKPGQCVQSGIQRGVQRGIQRGFRQGIRGRTSTGIQSAVIDGVVQDIANTDNAIKDTDDPDSSAKEKSE